MIIGVPKEIKNNENRVGMTPAGVHEMVAHGHKVYVQATAGNGSGFSDDDYRAAGAEILPGIADVYAVAEMIVKVKEPIEPEYRLRNGEARQRVAPAAGAYERGGRAHVGAGGVPLP